MDKVFALVDCNSFFCSCERLFRPDLRGKPVGVLSNNDGCFVSRTTELKRLGVKMGEPYFKVKSLCEKHKVHVFSANFSLYANLSDRVMMTLGDMSPEVEVYSVDEAFLCLKGMRPEQLDSFGLHIKKRVELLTGIPVSLGIAPTKTLAKVANNLAKKRPELGGVLSVMDREKQDWALRQIPVGDIWGIGRKKAQRLEMMNIRRGIELRDFKNDRFIQKEFTKVSRMTVDELRGISCFDLELEPSKKKEIISSRTFGQPVYELKSLKESIASYASLACEKLRLQDSVCSEVEIWIRTNPHKNVEQYYALESFRFLCPTSDTCKVIEGAFEALKKIYRGGFEYKKALVKLKGIRDKSDYQLSLFEKFDSDQSEKLMLVMDKINQKDGRHTLKSAACGTDQKAWKMKQVLKSPRYVSGWSELPLVK